MEVLGLEGKELLQILGRQATKKHELLTTPTLNEKLMQKVSLKEWEKAEKNCHQYNGLSARMIWQHNQWAQEKEAKDTVTHQKSSMKAVLQSGAVAPSASTESTCPPLELVDQHPETTGPQDNITSLIIADKVFSGYLSDLPTSDSDSDEEVGLGTFQGSNHLSQSSPLKKHCHKILVCIAHQQNQEQKQRDLEQVLYDIKKLIQSKQDVFDAGQHGLQAYHACTIRSCLWMIVHKKRGHVEASNCAGPEPSNGGTVKSTLRGSAFTESPNFGKGDTSVNPQLFHWFPLSD
ncbi:hypothetical protein V8B97DRAFT_1914033 [Scleroderma yunnanense]